MYWESWVGYFTKCLIKKWTQWDLRFWKNKGSKRCKNNTGGVNKIKNQGM